MPLRVRPRWGRRTKAAPISGDHRVKNCLNVMSAPAEPPMPTMQIGSFGPNNCGPPPAQTNLVQVDDLSCEAQTDCFMRCLPCLALKAFFPAADILAIGESHFTDLT